MSQSTKFMFICCLLACSGGVAFANSFISGATDGYVLASISRKTTEKLSEKETVYYHREYLNLCYKAKTDDKFVEISKEICQSDNVKELFSYAKIKYEECPTSEDELVSIGKKFCSETKYWFVMSFIGTLITLIVYILAFCCCLSTCLNGTDEDREYIAGVFVGGIVESMLNGDD